MPYLPCSESCPTEYSLPVCVSANLCAVVPDAVLLLASSGDVKLYSIVSCVCARVLALVAFWVESMVLPVEIFMIRLISTILEIVYRPVRDNIEAPIKTYGEEI